MSDRSRGGAPSEAGFAMRAAAAAAAAPGRGGWNGR